MIIIKNNRKEKVENFFKTYNLSEDKYYVFETSQGKVLVKGIQADYAEFIDDVETIHCLGGDENPYNKSYIEADASCILSLLNLDALTSILRDRVEAASKNITASDITINMLLIEAITAAEVLSKTNKDYLILKEALEKIIYKEED